MQESDFVNEDPHGIKAEIALNDAQVDAKLDALFQVWQAVHPEGTHEQWITAPDAYVAWEMSPQEVDQVREAQRRREMGEGLEEDRMPDEDEAGPQLGPVEDVTRLTWPGYSQALRSTRTLTDEELDAAIEVEHFRDVTWVDHQGLWVLSGTNEAGARVTLNTLDMGVEREGPEAMDEAPGVETPHRGGARAHGSSLSAQIHRLVEAARSLLTRDTREQSDELGR
jgi:hypothetical protein